MRDRLRRLAAAPVRLARADAGQSAARGARRSSALVALGYKPAEVDADAQAVRTGGDGSTEELIRRALQARCGSEP